MPIVLKSGSLDFLEPSVKLLYVFTEKLQEKVKVKLILEQAMKVQKGEKSSYYSSFNMARVPDGLDVYRHDLVALP